MGPQEPIQDIRYSYNSDRSEEDSTQDSFDDEYEQDGYFYRPSYSNSDRSYHTQPSDYSTSPVYPTKRPALLHHHDTCLSQVQTESKPSPTRFFDDREPQHSPQASLASINTYTSTVPSFDEEQEQDPKNTYTLPSHTSLALTHHHPIPAPPSDFSSLFPSPRRLLVRHDDNTLDGNMNLRIDTEIQRNPHNKDDVETITLFHLRMHDLRSRSFSLRRYHRDSGREVCHCIRKSSQQAAVVNGLAKPRPTLQQSMSHALRSLRSKSEQKGGLPALATGGLRREDSGYASLHEREQNLRPKSAGSVSASASLVVPKALREPRGKDGVVKLDFANYAQMEIRPRGKGGKNARWEFEYWGVGYAWRRDAGAGVSFRLVSVGNGGGNGGSRNGGGGKAGDGAGVLAYMVALPLSAEQRERERAMGGWVPGCKLWIADEEVLEGEKKDVADVIVASALIALVDNAISTHFHPSNKSKNNTKTNQSSKLYQTSSSQRDSQTNNINSSDDRDDQGTVVRRPKPQRQHTLTIPIPGQHKSKSYDVEYVGPKRLLGEIFGRRKSHDQTAGVEGCGRDASGVGNGSTGRRAGTTNGA